MGKYRPYLAFVDLFAASNEHCSSVDGVVSKSRS